MRIRSRIAPLVFTFFTVVTASITLMLGTVLIFTSTRHQASTTTLIEQSLLRERRSLVQSQTERTLAYIRFLRRQSVDRYRAILGERIDHGIAHLDDMGVTSAALANDPALARRARQELSTGEFNRAGGFYFILSATGTILLDTFDAGREGTSGFFFSDAGQDSVLTDFLEGVMNDGQRFIIVRHTDGMVHDTGRPAFVLARRHKDTAMIIGYIMDAEAVEQSLRTEITTVVDQVEFAHHGRAFIVDKDGILAGRPFSGALAADDPLTVAGVNGVPILDRIRTISREGGGYIEYTYPITAGSMTHTMAFVRPLEIEGWSIGSMLTLDGVAAERDRLVRSEHDRIVRSIAFSIGIYLLMILFTSAVSYWFAHRIRRELATVIDYFRAARTDARPIDVQILAIDEFRSIASAANAMLEARKLAEQGRRMADSALESIIRSIPDVIYRLDTDGIITYISPAIEQYGYTAEEVVGRSIFELINFEDRAKAAHHIIERRTGERRTMNYELRLMRKDRSDIPFEIRSRGSFSDPVLLITAEGMYATSEPSTETFLGTQGVARDITERKDAMEKLEHYRYAVENAGELIVLLDRKYRILLANKAALKFAGRKIDDILHMTAADILGRERFHVQIKHILDHCLGGVIEQLDTPATRSDGESRMLRVVIYPSEPDAENHRNIVLVARDITEEYIAERTLGNEKERLAVTLASIGDAVIATDAASMVTLMNPEAERLTGWSMADARNHALPEVVKLIDFETRQLHPDPSLAAIRNGTYLSATDYAVLLAHDGEHIVGTSVSPIHEPDGQTIGAVVVLHDMSERLRMEEGIQRARSLESLGILAGGIAHNFNNILAAIMAAVSLARMNLTADSTAALALDDAERETLRARELTRRFITFSRGGAPVKTTASIGDIVRNAAAFTAQETNAVIEFVIPRELWPASVDAGQITQVINNIVLNAAQAMPDGGSIIVTAENLVIEPDTHRHLKPGRHVAISIRDTGQGIKPGDITRIFVPYFTTKESGAGLGLTTSYSIIRRHDGCIDVSSEPGKGALFTIYIPASSETDAPEPPASKTDDHIPRILFMDDEVTIRTATGKILERLGYEVAHAGDGVQAVAQYRDAFEAGRPFDLLILDLTVPGGMGGLECFHEIRAIDPSARAVVSSGYSADPIMADYEKYGFSGVVVKPYSVAELSGVLNRIFGV